MTYEEYLKQQALNESEPACALNESKVHLRRLGEKVHLRRLGEQKAGRLSRTHLRRMGEGAVQDRHDRFDANKKNWTEYVDTIYKAYKEGNLNLTRDQASTFYMLKNYFLKHDNEKLFNRNGVETINPIRKIYKAVTKGDYKTAEDLIADFKSPLRAE